MVRSVSPGVSATSDDVFFFARILRKCIFISAIFFKISARVYSKDEWITHLMFLMKVMFLNGINK